MNNYLMQKCTPWVSFAVLAGGLTSALVLFWLINIEGAYEAAINTF